ncbi:hypothetical protein FACS1894202_14560 [Clostridia bacterium]|nr:hypothetical protein FACS1894202_14560 [Clostridia bacterium]
MRIAQTDDIVFISHSYQPYANVIFTHEMKSAKEKVKMFFKQNDISLIGRFGEWDYLWSDQSYLSGKYAGKELRSKI